MSTWTDISNPSVAVGGIPSSATVTALRDNPVAIAGAASGAPIDVNSWHPVDKVTVGDGKTGLIYDHAVNGTLSTIETPDFEDGYEYRILASGLSHDNASARTLRIQLYFEVSATYSSLYTTTNTASNSDFFDMDAEILLPRVSRWVHLARVMASITTSVQTTVNGASAAASGNAEKVLRARLSFSAGSVDGGKVWLFRRREYASSP
jgi:hypothetical protein